MALKQSIWDKARKLVNTKPLPANIYDQLDELRKDVPAVDRPEFAWFYEAAKNQELPDSAPEAS